MGIFHELLDDLECRYANDSDPKVKKDGLILVSLLRSDSEFYSDEKKHVLSMAEELSRQATNRQSKTPFGFEEYEAPLDEPVDMSTPENRVVGHIVVALTPHYIEKIVDCLIDELSESLEKNPSDAINSISALTRLGRAAEKATPVLLRFLEEEKFQGVHRNYTIEHIGRLRSEQTVEPLLKFLKSSDHNTVVAAIRGLATIGDPRAIEPIFNMIVSPNEFLNWQLKEILLEAAFALVRLGDTRGVRYLISEYVGKGEITPRARLYFLNLPNNDEVLSSVVANFGYDFNFSLDAIKFLNEFQHQNKASAILKMILSEANCVFLHDFLRILDDSNKNDLLRLLYRMRLDNTVSQEDFNRITKELVPRLSNNSGQVHEFRPPEDISLTFRNLRISDGLSGLKAAQPLAKVGMRI